jgi:hypothetical protein
LWNEGGPVEPIPVPVEPIVEFIVCGGLCIGGVGTGWLGGGVVKLIFSISGGISSSTPASTAACRTVAIPSISSRPDHGIPSEVWSKALSRSPSIVSNECVLLELALPEGYPKYSG